MSKKLPFPSSPNTSSRVNLAAQSSPDIPWARCSPTEPPPMMFQLQFVDGHVISYAYADLRETRLRDAGFLQLCLLGMEKTLIDISGRNLTELAELIVLGKIKAVQELGPRSFDRPEAVPSIDSITVEHLTGPAP